MQQTSTKRAVLRMICERLQSFSSSIHRQIYRQLLQRPSLFTRGIKIRLDAQNTRLNNWNWTDSNELPNWWKGVWNWNGAACNEMECFSLRLLKINGKWGNPSNVSMQVNIVMTTKQKLGLSFAYFIYNWQYRIC